MSEHEAMRAFVRALFTDPDEEPAGSVEDDPRPRGNVVPHEGRSTPPLEDEARAFTRRLFGRDDLN